MNTSDEDALNELRGYPGWTPERQRLAEAVVERGLGAAFDFAVARVLSGGQSSSNSSAVFVVADAPGRASVDPGLWDVLEPELRALLAQGEELVEARSRNERRRRSTLGYWVIDWPVFLFQSGFAWYFTAIGVLGALCILMVLVIAVLWFGFGIRWGW